MVSAGRTAGADSILVETLGAALFDPFLIRRSNFQRFWRRFSDHGFRRRFRHHVGI